MILTVIIISYNVKDFLIECLDSIYKTDIENNLFEIIKPKTLSPKNSSIS